MPESYIRKNEHCVPRVGAPRVVLDSVVAAFKQGHSAETIRQQDPALTREEIRGCRPRQRGKTNDLAGEPAHADRLAEMRSFFSSSMRP